MYAGLESSGGSTGDGDLGEVGNLVDRLAISLEGPAEDGVFVLGGHLGLGRLSLQLCLLVLGGFFCPSESVGS